MRLVNIIIFLLSAIQLSSFAQTKDSIILFHDIDTVYESEFNKASKYFVDQLLKSDADTVIILSHRPYPMYFEDINGIGNSAVFEYASVIGIKNGLSHGWRLIDCYPDSSHNGKILFSNSVSLEEISLLNSLKQTLPKIEQRQHFLDFTYEIYSNGVKGYYSLQRFHQPQINITIKSKNHWQSFDFEEYVLHKRIFYDDKIVNLNYEYNNSLPLYSLYSKLQIILNLINRQFVFTRTGNETKVN